MTVIPIPPPPKKKKEESDEFQLPPPRSRIVALLLIPLLLGGAVVMAFFVRDGSENAKHIMDLQQDPPLDAPAIRLKPSLVVPGPGQQPHPLMASVKARPDEAIIFRVNVGGSGYVMIAREDPGGKLTRLYGGRPDETPVSGSKLLYEDNLVLAYAMESHRGSSVTFIAALSSEEWREIPSHIASSPRTFPDPEKPEVKTGFEPILAWDRVTVEVLKEIPKYPLDSE